MCQVAFVAGGLLLALLGTLAVRSTMSQETASRVRFPSLAIAVAVVVPVLGIVLALMVC